jgi:hypothetical protein
MRPSEIVQTQASRYHAFAFFLFWDDKSTPESGLLCVCHLWFPFAFLGLTIPAGVYSRPSKIVWDYLRTNKKARLHPPLFGDECRRAYRAFFGRFYPATGYSVVHKVRCSKPREWCGGLRVSRERPFRLLPDLL